jgi:hypothetical protein
VVWTVAVEVAKLKLLIVAMYVVDTLGLAMGIPAVGCATPEMPLAPAATPDGVVPLVS